MNKQTSQDNIRAEQQSAQGSEQQSAPEGEAKLIGARAEARTGGYRRQRRRSYQEWMEPEGGAGVDEPEPETQETSPSRKEDATSAGDGATKPDGTRKRRAKKVKDEEPTESWPEEAQPAPAMPKPERTAADYKIEDIIADDSDETELSVEAPTIPKLVDKLPKSKYLRIRGGKDSQTQVYAVRLDEEDQRPGELNSYILTKKMRDYFVDQLEYKVTKMNVCDVCTIQGKQFLFMHQATSNLSNNSWNVSRARVLTAATREWVIVISRMDEREYDYRTRAAHLPPVEPRFPKEPITERVFRAVQGGRLIDSVDHPVVKRLLGVTEDTEDDE
jgi:hypothetical protein